MNNFCIGLNYERATIESTRIDEEIIDVLKSGCNFRVEAGAGSGKTYSLNKVIEWIQKNKQKEYCRKKQNVICVTFTNAAVDVITDRLPKDSFIVPSTIHSFAWNAIQQYQSYLISKAKDYNVPDTDHTEIIKVTYTLGLRSLKNGTLYLSHHDVLTLFCSLLDNAKFRRIFTDKYPIILIDEYQDSNARLIEQFLKFFIDKKNGPQFGFFGDSWQTIYKSNNACGLIDHKNISVIQKAFNFRSAPKIVELLNKLRPDLPQESAIDNFDGVITVVTSDDFNGDRCTDKYLKGDLPTKELQSRVDKIKEKITQSTPNDESLKILMITHKVLAKQQGYADLLKILGDSLKNQDDPFILFFKETIEPIYSALTQTNSQMLFDALGIKRFPITKKADKLKWKKLQEDLTIARQQKTIDVLHLIFQSKLIPIPDKVEHYYQLYQTAPNTIYQNRYSIHSFLNLNYQEVIAVINYFDPNSIFSTDHGVKGEEYDNVLFVISKGWSQYQFEKYAPMILSNNVDFTQQKTFEANRNLFYVCCSRAKKRLIFFITTPVDSTFRKFLTNLVGDHNIYTYSQYLSQSSL